MGDSFPFAHSGLTESLILPALQCPTSLSKGKIDVLDTPHLGSLRMPGKRAASRGLSDCSVWQGHFQEKMPRTTTGEMQSEISRISFRLVFLMHCAANTRPGFGTERRKSADVTEIRQPFQQEQTFQTSLPALLTSCHPTALSHVSPPGALRCTCFQRYPEERAMTADLTRDSQQGELALSPAFPVCIGSEKKLRTFFQQALHMQKFSFSKGAFKEK